MELPQEFFTLQSMLTLTGATGATFVVANGLQRAFNFNPKWLGLAIAEIICIFGVIVSHKTPPAVASDYFIGVVNGFLVFCTASGATSATRGKPVPDVAPRGIASSEGAVPVRPRRGFFTSWF